MEISILTAQNVNISYKPAGLVLRIGSTLIDYAFLGGLSAIFYSFFHQMPLLRHNNILLLILLTLIGLYPLLCEFFFHGQTLGKYLLHTRVVRLDGHPLTFWDCLLRWILRIVDIGIGLGTVAIVSIIATSKMQRLGDLAANTTVISAQKGIPLDSLYIQPQGKEGHIVTFPQITLLSDRDFSIIREIYQTAEQNQEYRLLEPLAQKVKDLTGIETRMSNRLFIQTIIADYIHLTR